ncbi:MAG: TetR/AcrR family transcriptional regulator C-terminal domain-containing protein [Erysipelotrichaceae bacterium]
MKRETASYNTKKKMADSLKKAMTRKPLSKITVAEIIKDCDVNRKTFYYHFEDIYSLMKWMLEQETVEVLKKFDLLVNPEEALDYMISYCDENKHIINCAYDSVGREEMKRFFYNDLSGTVESIIQELSNELDIRVNDDYKLFLTSFYTEALAGVLVNYFQGQETHPKDKLIEYLILTLKSSLPNVLKSSKYGVFK